MKIIHGLTVVVGSFGLCYLGASIIGQIGGPDNMRSESSKVPVDLVKDGHHDSAMAQARQLLEELRKNDWNRFKVDPRLLRLPDQDFAESQLMRNPSAPSFTALPTSIGIYAEKVALFSPTYVRTIRTPDAESTEGIGSVRAEGFFIVGWKDGRVEKVPVDLVRLYPYKLGKRTIGAYVFPGMTEYDPALPSYTGAKSAVEPPAPRKK